MSATVTLYEVRGNHPDNTLRYFTRRTGPDGAEACVKENPKLRIMEPIEVEMTKAGICATLTHLFEWIEEGVTDGKIESGDRPRICILKEELAEATDLIERLRRACQFLYENGDTVEAGDAERYFNEGMEEDEL